MSRFAIRACLVLFLMTPGEWAASGAVGDKRPGRKLLYVEEESTEWPVANDNHVPKWMQQMIESRKEGHGKQKRRELTPTEVTEGMKTLYTVAGVDKLPHKSSALPAVLQVPSPSVKKPQSSPSPSPEKPTVQPKILPPEMQSVKPISSPAEAPVTVAVPAESPIAPPVESPMASPPAGSPVTAPLESPVVSPSATAVEIVPTEMQRDRQTQPQPSTVSVESFPSVVPESDLEPEEMPATASVTSEVAPSESEAMDSFLSTEELESEPLASEITPSQAGSSEAPIPESQPSISLPQFPCEADDECAKTSPQLSVMTQRSAIAEASERPKQASSLLDQDSTTRMQAEPSAEGNKGSDHIGHGVKVASWTLASICLVLVVVGNVLGIYYSRNRRRRGVTVTETSDVEELL